MTTPARDRGVSCAVGPDAPGWLRRCVATAGCELVGIEEADVLLWSSDGSGAALEDHLRRADRLRWIQLPSAGIERYREQLSDRYLWTCAKGVYARQVAEHALALTLAGLRHVASYGRKRAWSEPLGRSLHGASVLVVGGGGIAKAFLELIAPFDCHTSVIRRSGEPLAGASQVYRQAALDELLPAADVVLLAVALTPETAGIIGEEQLRAMGDDAWLVNVSRGRHVDTDSLVRALGEGWIGGAALDVTDPEPLPDGHPLWGFDNCIVTPHAANPPAMLASSLSDFTIENLRRYKQGRTLLGRVSVDLGY